MNEKFVPFAPSWGDGRGKYPWWQATWKDFFAHSAEKLHLSTIPGSLWFTMTAAGQPVPARKANGGGPKSSLAGTLKQILELYARMPEGQRKPAQPITDANRPTLGPPPGGLVLTIYDRFLKRDANGEYRTMASLPPCHPQQRAALLPGPQRNSLWLTEEECGALMPDDPRRGQTLHVPAKLVRRIALFGLLPGSAWQAEYQWKADSMRDGGLVLTVEEVSPSRVRLRLDGTISLATPTVPGYGVDRPNLPKGFKNRYDARLQGQIDYDPARKRITRWDMVALGDYLGLCYAYDHPRPFATRPLALGFTFELDRGSYDLPAELRRNKPMLMNYLPEQFYFDPERWEAATMKSTKR